MNIDKLFNTLVGGYHDGALCDAIYHNNALYLQCFRNPPDPERKEDPNYRYVIIRFDHVTDLEIYNWDSKSYVPYTEGSFKKDSDYWETTGIDYLDYEEDYVVFGECMRFHADDVELLAHSSEELDFSAHCNIG